MKICLESKLYSKIGKPARQTCIYQGCRIDQRRSQDHYIRNERIRYLLVVGSSSLCNARNADLRRGTSVNIHFLTIRKNLIFAKKSKACQSTSCISLTVEAVSAWSSRSPQFLIEKASCCEIVAVARFALVGVIRRCLLPWLVIVEWKTLAAVGTWSDDSWLARLSG